MSMGSNVAESPSNNRSPRGGGDGPKSPQTRRTGSNTAAARNLSSPWANVVRGGGSVEREAVSSTASAAAVAPPSTSSSSVAEVPPPDPAQESDCSPAKALSPGNAVAEATPESSDSTANGSGNAAKAAKKPAWNKPSNGVVEAGPVMGAAWPALSESARVSAKSSDSLRAPSDGSTPVAVSTGPATASPLHKPTTNNSTPNHVLPARHKFSKRSGGGMGPTNNGGFMPPPAETPHNAPDKPVAAAAAAAAEVPPDSSPRDPPHKDSNWEAGPRAPFIQQSHFGTDSPRGAFRRGNGPPRRDGNYHGGYGSRRDHERASYEWNQPQGFNGRDVHVRQPRVLPRNFIRPPAPAPGPFVAPPPIRPYGGPMGFPDLHSPQYYITVPPPESVRGGPFVAHPGPPPPMFYPPAAQLQNMLLKQIDYYFSAENLCKDLFLRRHMDEQGWVPVSLIANFNRVKQLTNNIHFILDTLRMSAVVEVQGDKIRSRSDWKSWILQSSSQSPPSAGSQSPGTSRFDVLATGMPNVGLEDQKGKKNHMNGPVAAPATYSDEEMGQTINHTTTDQLISSRNLGRGDSS